MRLLSVEEALLWLMKYPGNEREPGWCMAQNIADLIQNQHKVVDAAKDLDGHTELCKAMTPTRGCTCGIRQLEEALQPFQQGGGA